MNLDMRNYFEHWAWCQDMPQNLEILNKFFDDTAVYGSLLWQVEYLMESEYGCERAKEPGYRTWPPQRKEVYQQLLKRVNDAR